MKKGLTAALIPAALFLTIASSGLAVTGEGEEIFFQSNQAYREGRYEDAAEGYGRLLREEGAGGHLFYNIGNTYFRLGDLGRAILNYERSRIFLPRDADLRFNLEHARGQLQDAVPENQDFLDTTFFWLGSVTLDEIFWLFAFTNILLWSAAALRLFLKAEGLYYSFIFLLVLWLACGMSLGVKRYQAAADDRSVILSAEVRVLAGPDAGDTVHFKLHAGTIVHQERVEDEWALIRLPDGKRGWVESQSVEHVQREKTGP